MYSSKLLMWKKGTLLFMNMHKFKMWIRNIGNSLDWFMAWWEDIHCNISDCINIFNIFNHHALCSGRSAVHHLESFIHLHSTLHKQSSSFTRPSRLDSFISSSFCPQHMSKPCQRCLFKFTFDLFDPSSFSDLFISNTASVSRPHVIAGLTTCHKPSLTPAFIPAPLSSLFKH